MRVLCYAAGYDGFWLARLLEQRGIECLVMEPASLQVIGDIPRAPIADPGQILHLLGVGLGDVRDVSGGDKLCH